MSKTDSDANQQQATKKRKVESTKGLLSHGGVVGVDGKEFEYCPYNETSQSYDTTRKPLGVNIGLGFACLSGHGALSELDILDVGCGTGTYLKHVQPFFKSVTGLEYNDGMIGEARKLLGKSAKLVQGPANKMPFADASFHVVTINQVVHHFPTDDEGKFSYLADVLKECARLLKPNGSIVISTSTPEQQRDAFWWLALFPKTTPSICGRFPPLEIFSKHLKDAGFTWNSESVTVPISATLMSEKQYLTRGVDGAFEPFYRDGDSSFSMAEKCGELEEGLEALRVMKKEGTDGAWLAKRELLRKSIGQATFLTCRKL